MCELVSPPRVTVEMQRLPYLGVAPGRTYDLRFDRDGKSWNFLLESDRKRARREIATEKPFLVIGSPPCTFYSQLQAFNRHKVSRRDLERRRTEADAFLQFVAEIYVLQLRAGRHVLHEHPVWGRELVMPLACSPLGGHAGWFGRGGLVPVRPADSGP